MLQRNDVGLMLDLCSSLVPCTAALSTKKLLLRGCMKRLDIGSADGTKSYQATVDVLYSAKHVLGQ